MIRVRQMVRLSVQHHGPSKVMCSICLEEKSMEQNPSQLPCVHFMCSLCLRKLFPPLPQHELGNNAYGRSKKGIACPVCRTEFPNHRVAEHPSVPGGVALMEHVAASDHHDTNP